VYSCFGILFISRPSGLDATHRPLEDEKRRAAHFTVKMDEKNHHLHKPVFIGEVRADGQFNVVWKTKGPIKAQPWSPFIPENKGKKDEPEKK
jgi:hypothetical protein